MDMNQVIIKEGSTNQMQEEKGIKYSPTPGFARAMYQQQKETRQQKGQQMNSVPGTYKKVVLEILMSLKRLSLLPLTTLGTQLEKTVEDWCEILYGVVPEEKLRECFKLAYREKKEGIIFEAHHICQTWYRERAKGVSIFPTNCTLCVAFRQDVSAGKCPFHIIPF